MERTQEKTNQMENGEKTEGKNPELEQGGK